MIFKKIKQSILLAATLIIAVAGLISAKGAVMLNGAGASFPYPIYSKWFYEYNKLNPDVQINYQSIGSGGGIRQITAKTVDFGATDGPMSDDQLFKVDGKILHIPTVLGAVVPIYNLPDFSGELNFNGQVLADIFLGKIKFWNDPAIAELNPQAKLPTAPIVVVHRSDGSGTSYCFTDYLSKVSAEWKKQVGKGTSVNWPAGLGGKGNEGVAGAVKQTANSIGYVELIYATQNNLAYGSVKNKAGNFVKANIVTVSEAANGAAKNMPKDYRVSITNAPGRESYPIATFTWLLIYQKTGGPKGEILKNFLRWMIADGQKTASQLGYAPLPETVIEMLKKTIETIQ